MQFRYEHLINLGVHLGHNYENSLIESAWMVYAFRERLLIIDLFKFLRIIRIAFDVIKHAINKRCPIWFVNLEPSFDRYTRIAAEKCGEFSTTLYWIKGMLSNFGKTTKSFLKLSKLNRFVKNRKNRLFDINYKRWLFTRYTWPRAIFISSVESSYFAANEANSFLIPSIGIVDTTTDSQTSSVAVPGNDDSLECIVFYNNMICSYILYRKIVGVVIWFFNVRRARRVVNFKDWLFKKSSNIKISNWYFIPFKYYNTKENKVGYLSLRFFSAKSIWLDKVVNQLYIFKLNYDKVSIVNQTISGLDTIQDKIYKLYQGYRVQTGIIKVNLNILKNIKYWKSSRKQMQKYITYILSRVSNFKYKYKYGRKFRKIIQFFSTSCPYGFYVNTALFFILHEKRRKLGRIFRFFKTFKNIKKKIFFFFLMNVFHSRKPRSAMKNTRVFHNNLDIHCDKPKFKEVKNKIYIKDSIRLSIGYIWLYKKSPILFNYKKILGKYQFRNLFFLQSRENDKNLSLIDFNRQLSRIVYGLTYMPQFRWIDKRILSSSENINICVRR